MSILDRFLPPPGAPGAVRVGAGCWGAAGVALGQLADDTRSRAGVLSASWEGAAADAFRRTVAEFVASVDSVAGMLRDVAGVLETVADAIEHAQDEYHHRMGMVVGTCIVAVALTVPTFGASDELGAGAVALELGAALEVASTATAAATAALAQIAAQAGRLALQAAVFGGVNVATDAGSSWLVYRDQRAFQHLDVRGDLEWGLIGGLAAPLREAMALGAGGLPGLTAGGVSRVVTPLALTGLSMASADVLVRLALGEHVDAEELAMAAVPLGPKAKRFLSEKPGMIGDKGTNITSRGLTQGTGWHLDVENPNPGQRAGQIHLQADGRKWLYDLASGTFPDAPPKLIARLMKDPGFRAGLHKGFKYLDEEVM